MSSPPEQVKPGGSVKELKTATDSSSEEDLQRMFSKLSNGIQDESPRDRIAALPTGLRYTLAAALSLAVPVGLWLARHQVLPLTFSLPRQLAVLTAYGLCLGSILYVALRPLHRPLLSRSWMWFHALCPFLLVSAMALWPTDVPEATALPSHGPLSCLLFGTAVGLMLYLLLRILDRGQRLFALLSAAGATVLANAALQVSCSDAGIAHRGWGHAGVGGLFLLGLALAHLYRRNTHATNR